MHLMRCQKKIRILEIGVGSGCIAITLKKELSKPEITAIDISKRAVKIAKLNAQLLNADLSIKCIDFFEYKTLKKFDVIISNPPYISDSEELPLEVSEWEPSSSLRSGPLGTEDLSFLLNNSIEWLSAEGQLILELAPMQADQLVEEAKNLNFREVQLRNDLTGRDRVLMAKKPL